MQPGGQRLDQGNTMRVSMSNHFLTRHQRPPVGPNTSAVVGPDGFFGSLLQGAPVCSLIATSGIVRAAFLANDGSQYIGNLFTSGVLGFLSGAMPPPFSLLSFSPTSATGGSKDATIDAVTVVCVTTLLWWFGRPAERRWGPGRFLTYLLVGYTASIAAFVVAAAFGSTVSIGASIWMVPAISLFLNNVRLSSANKFSGLLTLRGALSFTLLSYALLLNVTGGSFALPASKAAASASSSRFRNANVSSSSSPNLFLTLASLAPSVILGGLVYYFCSPSEAYILHRTSRKAAADDGSNKPQLPPSSREGSVASAGAEADSKKVSGRLQTSVQRLLYAVAAPNVVRPAINRLLSFGSKNSGGANNTTRQANPSSTSSGHKNFKRRLITRIEDIGYTRAGVLMTDEEEVMYAAQLQGLMPALPHQIQRQQQQDQARHRPPGAAPPAQQNQPLTTDQQAKVQTLLEIGLPNIDAGRATQALASAGWELDAAVTLLMEEMN
eukprot:GILI01011832.1.p1 GENE.GILI01011832.1~~GILI01011832.1.p1  ORF type:complete len:519 (+),score=92.34 GILI01011832.1:70-1557(+)